MKREEKILLYGANLWYFGEGMLGPLFAIFAERIGGDILDISWAWALYLIVGGLLQVIFGRLSDGFFNAKKLMVFGYALNALLTFGYLFVQSPLHLFLVQIGLGIASAMATPTWDALYDEHSTPGKKGLIWGLAAGEADIVMGIGLILGGFLVSYFSFSALFMTMGVIQIIATIYQARILKRG